MPYVKDTLGMAFKYHREKLVEKLSSWSTQTVNNRLRMGIMHRYPDICIRETEIPKAQWDGVKCCTQVGPIHIAGKIRNSENQPRDRNFLTERGWPRVWIEFLF